MVQISLIDSTETSHKIVGKKQKSQLSLKRNMTVSASTIYPIVHYCLKDKYLNNTYNVELRTKSVILMYYKFKYMTRATD